MSDALFGLRALAEAVPVAAAAAPSLVRPVTPDVAAGADALFILGALSASGVLPPELMPWDDEFAASAFASAASSANRDAFLALGDRLVHGEPAAGDCQAGLSWLRAAADEVLESATQAADHAVPKEPMRLRDRLRDGAWKPDAGDDEAAQQLQMEEDLAARGVPEAQRHLGYRQLLGRGVPPDAAAAAVAFAEAAAAGDEYAQFNLVCARGLDIAACLFRADKPRHSFCPRRAS